MKIKKEKKPQRKNKMSTPIYQVDAFTSQPFRGNPAGVCLLSEPRADAWMQDVAREMNLSETAFLVPEQDGYRLRWFTPAVEVDLCGHATLGSAHILFETGRVKADAEIHFYTRSGLLTAVRSGAWIELNFPVKPVAECALPQGMQAALGVPFTFVGKSQFDYLVEVADEAALRGITPDFAVLYQVEARGVIVTSRAASPQFDFVSRFFAPRVGVNEDPVTGSAHCVLAHYWSLKLGKTTFMAHQASARGGDLRVRLDGERVLIGGQAVTVIKGDLI
jgi:predicted PhzF superfamily epimerase YddE/YHI9